MDKNKKSRLGRGLSSLMGMNTAAEAPVDDFSPLPVHHSIDPGSLPEPIVPRGTPADVLITDIDPNPHQPRRKFADTNLAELAESIKANGVIQPIILKAVGGRYQLIAGERRLRASKLAGLDHIPAIIRDADELAQAQMALVENIQREDLNPLDRAAGYRTLVSELGLSQHELAGRLGEDRGTIANHLRLLELPVDVQAMIRDARISLGHAKVLCGITDPAEQLRLAELVISQGLSVRNLERAISSPPTLPTGKPDKSPPSAHLKDLELNLSKQLGVRVQVRTGSSPSKGKVVIHYNSLDEFDQLVGRMGIRLED